MTIHSLAILASLLAAAWQPVQAEVQYDVSVYTLPQSTWWGSFTVITDEFIATRTTFLPSEMSWCGVIHPDGQQCTSATFDPQGTSPDKVTFATTAGTIDFLFPDGWFSKTGGVNAIDSTGSLFIHVSEVPEPSAPWLLAAGLLGLGTLAAGRPRVASAKSQKLAT